MREHAVTDHALERLVFFSDAVFAIAITLLVIEIHPPHLHAGASDVEHWRALAGLIPNFLGFMISFLVIGAFWVGHHRAFALAARYDRHVMFWNLALLATVAFMPFVTAYLSSNMSARVPTLIYCLTLLLAAIFNLQTNRAATSPPLVSEDAPAEEIAHVRRRSKSVVLGAATAVILSIIVPQFGQIGLVSIPLWRKLLERAQRRAPA